MTAIEAVLAARDPVMAELVALAGPCPLAAGARRRISHFEYLAKSICYQQLTGKVAATIWGRVRALVPGPFTAPAVLALDHEVLRGAGLSNAKALALHDLADRVATGDVRLTAVARLDDDAVVTALTRVRGIGPWTAQMFLLFHLARPDVWPVTDYGVRVGIAQAWRLPELPTPAELTALGEPFRPYRSTLAWYAWQAADLMRDVPTDQ